MAKSTLFRNLKFRAFQNRLGIQRIYAQAHLDALWETAHTQGRPWFRSPEEAEMAAEWEGKPGVLFAALMAGVVDGDVGFLEALPDGTYGIHDYFEHLNTGLKKYYMRILNLSFSDVTNLSVLQYKDLQRKNVTKKESQGKKLHKDSPLPFRSLPIPSDPNPTPIKEDPPFIPQGGNDSGETDLFGDVIESPSNRRTHSVAPEDFQIVWNVMAATTKPKALSKVDFMTPDRIAKLRTRLECQWWREHWREGLALIPQIPEYILGSGKSRWRANPDWFLRNDRYLVKIFEKHKELHNSGRSSENDELGLE